MRHCIEAVILAAATTCGAYAQVVDPAYECAYTITSLGAPPGVPTPFGGLVISRNDNDVLLIGGAANQASGAVYAVTLLRDENGRITGFDGTAASFAAAPHIDGGLCYGPGDVLFFSRYSMNEIGQIKPGSAGMDKSVPLTPLGFSSSVGAVTFVPGGFPAAGRLKVHPYNSSRWHDAEVSPDGAGTYDIAGPFTNYLLGGGPEGIVYVEPGASLFPNGAILICEYSSGSVAAWDFDANADPVPGTRRPFITGLGGAEGGTRDPVTGDFLFSTWGGGDRVLLVRGFNPECAANYNGDCAFNTQDFLAFLNDWAAGKPKADINGDTVINTLDVLAFLNIFVAGCD